MLILSQMVGLRHLLGVIPLLHFVSSFTPTTSVKVKDTEILENSPNPLMTLLNELFDGDSKYVSSLVAASSILNPFMNYFAHGSILHRTETTSSGLHNIFTIKSDQANALFYHFKPSGSDFVSSSAFIGSVKNKNEIVRFGREFDGKTRSPDVKKMKTRGCYLDGQSFALLTGINWSSYRIAERDIAVYLPEKLIFPTFSTENNERIVNTAWTFGDLTLSITKNKDFINAAFTSSYGIDGTISTHTFANYLDKSGIHSSVSISNLEIVGGVDAFYNDLHAGCLALNRVKPSGIQNSLSKLVLSQKHAYDDIAELTKYGNEFRDTLKLPKTLVSYSALLKGPSFMKALVHPSSKQVSPCLNLNFFRRLGKFSASSVENFMSFFGRNFYEVIRFDPFKKSLRMFCGVNENPEMNEKFIVAEYGQVKVKDNFSNTVFSNLQITSDLVTGINIRDEFDWNLFLGTLQEDVRVLLNDVFRSSRSSDTNGYPVFPFLVHAYNGGIAFSSEHPYFVMIRTTIKQIISADRAEVSATIISRAGHPGVTTGIIMTDFMSAIPDVHSYNNLASLFAVRQKNIRSVPHSRMDQTVISASFSDLDDMDLGMNAQVVRQTISNMIEGAFTHSDVSLLFQTLNSLVLWTNALEGSVNVRKGTDTVEDFLNQGACFDGSDMPIPLNNKDSIASKIAARLASTDTEVQNVVSEFCDSSGFKKDQPLYKAFEHNFAALSEIKSLQALVPQITARRNRMIGICSSISSKTHSKVFDAESNVPWMDRYLRECLPKELTVMMATSSVSSRFSDYFLPIITKYGSIASSPAYDHPEFGKMVELAVAYAEIFGGSDAVSTEAKNRCRVYVPFFNLIADNWANDLSIFKDECADDGSLKKSKMASKLKGILETIRDEFFRIVDNTEFSFNYNNKKYNILAAYYQICHVRALEPSDLRLETVRFAATRCIETSLDYTRIEDKLENIDEAYASISSTYDSVSAIVPFCSNGIKREDSFKEMESKWNQVIANSANPTVIFRKIKDLNERKLSLVQNYADIILDLNHGHSQNEDSDIAVPYQLFSFFSPGQTPTNDDGITLSSSEDEERYEKVYRKIYNMKLWIDKFRAFQYCAEYKDLDLAFQRILKPTVVDSSSLKPYENSIKSVEKEIGVKKDQGASSSDWNIIEEMIMQIINKLTSDVKELRSRYSYDTVLNTFKAGKEYTNWQAKMVNTDYKDIDGRVLKNLDDENIRQLFSLTKSRTEYGDHIAAAIEKESSPLSSKLQSLLNTVKTLKTDAFSKEGKEDAASKCMNAFKNMVTLQNMFTSYITSVDKDDVINTGIVTDSFSLRDIKNTVVLYDDECNKKMNNKLKLLEYPGDIPTLDLMTLVEQSLASTLTKAFRSASISVLPSSVDLLSFNQSLDELLRKIPFEMQTALKPKIIFELQEDTELAKKERENQRNHDVNHDIDDQTEHEEKNNRELLDTKDADGQGQEQKSDKTKAKIIKETEERLAAFTLPNLDNIYRNIDSIENPISILIDNSNVPRRIASLTDKKDSIVSSLKSDIEVLLTMKEFYLSDVDNNDKNKFFAHESQFANAISFIESSIVSITKHIDLTVSTIKKAHLSSRILEGLSDLSRPLLLAFNKKVTSLSKLNQEILNNKAVHGELKLEIAGLGNKLTQRLNNEEFEQTKNHAEHIVEQMSRLTSQIDNMNTVVEEAIKKPLELPGDIDLPEVLVESLELFWRTVYDASLVSSVKHSMLVRDLTARSILLSFEPARESVQSANEYEEKMKLEKERQAAIKQENANKWNEIPFWYWICMSWLLCFVVMCIFSIFYLIYAYASKGKGFNKSFVVPKAVRKEGDVLAPSAFDEEIELLMASNGAKSKLIGK